MKAQFIYFNFIGENASFSAVEIDRSFVAKVIRHRRKKKLGFSKKDIANHRYSFNGFGTWILPEGHCPNKFL